MPRNFRVRIISRDQEDALNLQDWAMRTPEERVDAVSFLRRQYFAVRGFQTLPRLKRVIRIVERDG